MTCNVFTGPLNRAQAMNPLLSFPCTSLPEHRNAELRARQGVPFRPAVGDSTAAAAGHRENVGPVARCSAPHAGRSAARRTRTTNDEIIINVDGSDYAQRGSSNGALLINSDFAYFIYRRRCYRPTMHASRSNEASFFRFYRAIHYSAARYSLHTALNTAVYCAHGAVYRAHGRVHSTQYLDSAVSLNTCVRVVCSRVHDRVRKHSLVHGP